MQINQNLKRKILKQVGINVQLYRRKANISQETLALEVGVDRTYISAIEQGIKSPSIYCLFKIAEKLNIPTKELLDINL